MNTLRKVLLFCCLITLSSSAFSGIWGATNIFECLLDELPGVKNDLVASEIFMKCRKKFPDSPENIKKREPLFGVKKAGECVAELAKDVTSPKGAKWIKASCYQLYNKE